ncbi:MAG TPA: DUF3313 family protein [Arenimonas sp.]|nr:DUF3313 family protein [Arenimonas sp.]
MAIKTNLLVLLAFALAGPVNAEIPQNWDGLVEVKAQRVDAAYLLPGADFRTYTKVMIDPSEVAFKKNWLRDMNTPGRGSLDNRISADDTKKIIDGTQKNFDEVFAETLSKNGFTVVTAPGPDVLRLSPGVANLYINAPAVNGPSMTRTYVMEAGEGTLVLEVRDSMTNALLGRVLDRRATSNTGGMQYSNQSGNLMDYRALVRTWAAACSKGLDELKAHSPVPADLKPKQKL